ncbi:hypothetical protein NEOLEDRAFT_1242018 [Neolentinus lepideus HHB14362 ss-1]|uniref:Alcohol acetyltransferase n=1 Tax=Neolentinus lepideus HHB14362 ss-1 TaxID=1314782 RepID=A0A165SJW2_9AGAM|nr:hypothetical protein NEOLEDRAFT_1242018 [Neolentinus lepideus HHB14362 ss-1]
MSKSSKHNVVRTAGLLERYHVTRVALGLDTCVVVTARYVWTGGESSLTSAVLYPALRNVIQSEGALCVRVAYSPSPFKKPRFFRLPSINLDKIVEYKDGPISLQDALEQETSHGFDFRSTEKPLWRLTILPNNTVIFSYYHGIGDGMSGRAFHLSLLQALQTSIPQVKDGASEVEPVVEIPPQILMTLPIEKCTKVSVSFKALLRQLNPVQPASGLTAWTGNPVVAAIPTTKRLKNYVRLLAFTPTEITALIVICRQNKCTLTGAFHAVSVRALSQVLSMPEFQKSGVTYDSVSVCIPMSLRSLTHVPETAVCDHVSSHIVTASLPASSISISDDVFWTEAAKVSDELRTQRRKALSTIAVIRFSPLVGGLSGYYKSKLGEKREYGLSIINLGAWSKAQAVEDPAPHWTVAEMAFTQEDTIVSEPLKINLVGGGDGGLTITVNWGQSTVDVAFAEAFVKKLEEGTRSLVKTAS